MNMLDTTTWIILIVHASLISGLIGAVFSISNAAIDITKVIDYDRLKKENEDLKKAIEIKKDVK